MLTFVPTLRPELEDVYYKNKHIGFIVELAGVQFAYVVATASCLFAGKMSRGAARERFKTTPVKEWQSCLSR